MTQAEWWEQQAKNAEHEMHLEVLAIRHEMEKLRVRVGAFTPDELQMIIFARGINRLTQKLVRAI